MHRQAKERMKWVAPSTSADSDVDVDIDDIDDTVIDPDFLLDIGDDELESASPPEPSTSGL